MSQDNISEAHDQFRQTREQAQRNGNYGENVKKIIDKAEELAVRAGVATGRFDAVARVQLATIANGEEALVNLKDGTMVTMTIPKGATHGMVVNLRKGDAVPRVLVHEMEHPRFRREGPDLHAERAVNTDLLANGGETRVQTLTGAVMLNIQPGTKPGASIRFSGLGMPMMKQPERRGDIYLRITADEPS
jgi:DnaJ-class molecular chaperone